ncbi:MAG: ATP-dependent RNA helicase RhlE [Arenicella sp.]
MADETTRKMAKEFNTFKDFNLNKQLLSAIAEMGYETPTPIQQQAIPLVAAGHDLFGIAQTGTGKTAAFLLPILMKVKYAQGMNPRCLVIAPTRELAIQIAANLEELGKYTGIRHACAYGGIGMQAQMKEIAAGIDILIGTPGRIMDIYGKGGVVFKELRTLIMDEADKMMDMGFMPQIRRMLEVIPHKKRQNLLFSATMPEKVIELSEEFLDFPLTVEVTPQATAAETVEQMVYAVPNLRTKLNLLEDFLKDEESFNKIIVFTRTKVIADSVFKYLDRKASGEIRVIHANKGQNTRINSMEAFKNEEVRILVATDVAARGIDVSMVSHVINFDVPVIYEDYVHRIGRTGRANNAGMAITFCHEAERYHLDRIEKIIRTEIPMKLLPEHIEVVKTPFAEQQEIAMELDIQKRRENPDFKGAFHEKQPRKFGKKTYMSRKKSKGKGKK